MHKPEDIKKKPFNFAKLPDGKAAKGLIGFGDHDIDPEREALRRKFVGMKNLDMGK